jgi:tetratricopeptide (TPR) repeat protein
MVSDVIEPVAARMHRFLDTGDTSAILGVDADTEIARLTGYVAERPDDAWAVITLTAARWHRIRSLTDVDMVARELTDALPSFRIEQAKHATYDEGFLLAMLETRADDAVVGRAYAMIINAVDHQARARNGDAAARDIVIDMLASATRLLAEDAPWYALWRGALADSFHDRANHLSSETDLAEAIRIAESLVATDRRSDTFTVMGLADLALFLTTRARWRADVADIERAIDLCEQARRFDGISAADEHAALSVLATALVTRHELTGDLRDLDRATRAHASMTESPDGAFRRHVCQALVLHQLFGNTGDRAALDSGIDAFERALEHTAPTELERLTAVMNLGMLLTTRFGRTGGAADLDRGIETLRDALAALPTGHGDRLIALSQLCSAFLYRFDRDGSLRDLDLAVETGRLATADLSNRKQAIVSLANLAQALSSRHIVLGDRHDLDEAVAMCRHIVDLESPGSTTRGRNLANFAVRLYQRAQLTGDCTDIEVAITVVNEAIAMPDHGRSLHRFLGLRSGIFALRAEHSGDRADADEAITAAEAGIAAVTDDDPVRFSLLRTLANVLVRIGLRDADPAPMYRAVDLMWAAARLPNSLMSFRIDAARQSANLAMRLNEYPDALVRYELAIDLLPQVAWHGIDRSDRERFLAKMNGVAGLACSAALLVGQPARAVTLLEASRGRLWSQLLDLRHDFTRLHEALPELADRLDTIRRQLDPPLSAAMLQDVVTAPAWSASTDEDRARLAREWDALLAEVRRHPGLADFLRAPAFDDVASVGDHGPVVIVNCGLNHCDALILSGRRLEVLPLPTADTSTCLEMARTFLTAVHGEDDATESERAITDVLAWLWRAVAEPVLDRVGFDTTTATEHRRMWWCLTGPLSLLPVHAAGYHPGTDPGANVLDRVVSSYTTTLGVLQQARGTLAARQPIDKVLLVTPDSRGDLPFLAGGEREAAFLGSILAVDRLRQLSGSAATLDRVQDELPNHGIFHFGGHAVGDPRQPWDGGLRLADGQLAVSDLARCRPAAGGLAFLAACQTATSGTALPDENINLVSAVQCAGYQQVIGTLWPVRDAPAAFVTRQVYRHIVGDDHIDLSNTAMALHDAVRRLRQRHPDRPRVWAPFVHVGP